MKAKSYLSLLRSTALVFTATVVHGGATTGSWNVDAAGNWSDASKWTGGLPSGIGDTANLTYNISASRLIALAGNQTVGNLNIGDSGSSYFACTINSGNSSLALSKLTLDQPGVADAVITVPGVGGVAANGISCYGIVLKDNLVINTAFANSATVQLNVAALITDEAGSYRIIKNGAGIIAMGAVNTYKGGTTLNEGRVNANAISCFGSGTVTVASGAQVFINSVSNLANFSIAGSGYTNTADTGAQAGVIRLASTRNLFGNVTVTGAARLGVETTAVAHLLGNLTGSAALEINGPTTTTGSVTLSGSGSDFTGTLSLARGSFSFAGALGGSVTVAPVTGSTTTLGLGTAIGGNLSLDATNAVPTLRNNRGTVGIAGNLDLTGSSAVSPAKFPAPGTSSFTLLAYAARTGSGSLTFDATGYRGAPSLSLTANAAVITGLDGQSLIWNNASTDGFWNTNSSGNWTGGGNGNFYHADAVTFGDTAAGTVTLSGIVRPQSITFNSTGSNDYTVAGTGGIDACGDGIIKEGDAWVTLGGDNTFSGPVAIRAGRLRLGSNKAFGFTSGVTVKSGAAFDLNGQAMQGAAATVSLRVYDLTAEGSGDGSVPALTNTGAAVYPGTFPNTLSSGLRNLTLAGDLTIGGGTGTNFDISGIIEGNDFTLTKTGANQVSLLGTSKNLKTVVEMGTLSGVGPNPFGGTLTIKNSAIAQAGAAGTYGCDVIIESGGKLEHLGGIESLWTGTITATGDVELGNTNTSNTFMTLVKDFTVGGNLTKSGGGTVQLVGTVSVSGDLAITSGTLILGIGGSGGAISGTAPVIFSGTFPSLSVNRSDNSTLSNLISGAGSFNKLGTGTVTLTANNSYSGSTTISNGTLMVNGTHTGTGNVNLVAGTTLGGSGALPGAATIAVGSTLAPGSGIGTLTLGSTGKTTTINGTLRMQYDGSAVPATDQLKATAALTLGAASIIDFDALGTALVARAYVIGSYTTLTGTFATVTDLPAGYALVYNYNDGVTSTNLALVKTTTPYEAWIDTFFLGETNPAMVGPSADPDQDGLTNLLENYLGTNPKTASSGLMQVSSTGTTLTFQHSRADAPVSGYTPAYEWSTDLATWHDTGASVSGVTVLITSTVLTDNPSPANDVIQVVATVTSGSSTTLFVRLKTTTP